MYVFLRKHHSPGDRDQQDQARIVQEHQCEEGGGIEGGQECARVIEDSVQGGETREIIYGVMWMINIYYIIHFWILKLFRWSHWWPNQRPPHRIDPGFYRTVRGFWLLFIGRRWSGSGVLSHRFDRSHGWRWFPETWQISKFLLSWVADTCTVHPVWGLRTFWVGLLKWFHLRFWGITLWSLWFQGWIWWMRFLWDFSSLRICHLPLIFENMGRVSRSTM